MKKYFLVLLSCFTAFGFSQKTNSDLKNIKNIPSVSFIENKGQVSDQNYKSRPDILFSGTDGALVFHLKNNGISYQLNKVESWKEDKVITSFKETTCAKEKSKLIPGKITTYRLDVNWLNTNANTFVAKGKAMAGYNNYYLQGCPKGALNVKSFEEVTYKQIYKGIDLKWYQKNGHLKYDYIVAAGANYKNIQLQFSGATSIKLNNKGELLLITPIGNIIEQVPLVIQNRKILRSKWLIKNNIVSFDIENISKNEPFIIDPAVRVWGTYYGGAGEDRGLCCSADATGHSYLTGYTTSNTGSIIATAGAHQSVFGGGVYNAFLVKFDSLGVRQWATYYGDSAYAVGSSCTTDTIGNIYLAGYTASNSGSVIATMGAHQPMNGGGTNDAFLVKFNASGIRQWGTYYGGTGNDIGNSCTTDAAGNVYLAGNTTSNTGTLISTTGAHQFLYGGNSNDAFLVKFNASGVREWGTYYGGAGYEQGVSCSTDHTGNVYLAGNATANTGTIIVTAGAHQLLNGGNTDGFLVKFNTVGIRQWGTYYGGNNDDIGNSCITDAIGNVYLGGNTSSNAGTVIATAGAHQPAFGGGTDDAFLVKFDSLGARQWGTFYGGIGSDYGLSCATDAAGNLYFAGHATSSASTIIATAGSHQSVYAGSGNPNAFLIKFNTLGIRQWGTYYGGTGGTDGESCATDGTGNIYLAGASTPNPGTVIATVGSHQSLHGGATNDAFLVKFFNCTSPVSPTGSSVVGCSNNTFTLIATSNTATVNWYATPTSTAVLSTGNAYITPTLSVGIYTFYPEAVTCAPSATRTAITLTVNANPTISVNSGTICNGQSFTLTPNGANTYSFQGGNAIVNPIINTSYTVIGTSTAGCVSQSFATSNVTVNANPTITVNNNSICAGSSFTILPNGANTYTYSGGTAIVSPTTTTSFSVIGTNNVGCISAVPAISNVTVNPLPIISASSGTSLICTGQTTTLSAGGANSYTWNPGGSGSNISISPTITTNYTVTGMDANGCENDAIITQSVSLCTKINSFSLNHRNEVLIYPNPNDGNFTIELNFPFQIIIYNTIGQIIYNKKEENFKSEISIFDYSNGIYLIHLLDSNEKIIYTKKIIKN